MDRFLGILTPLKVAILYSNPNPIKPILVNPIMIKFHRINIFSFKVPLHTLIIFVKEHHIHLFF